MLSAATIRGRTQKLRNNCDFTFHDLFPLKCAGTIRPIKNRTPTLGLDANEFLILILIAAFACDSSTTRLRTTLRESGVQHDVLFIRAFHAGRHILVAVFDFVNLLHAGERFFPVAHPLVNKS